MENLNNIVISYFLLEKKTTPKIEDTRKCCKQTLYLEQNVYLYLQSV